MPEVGFASWRHSPGTEGYSNHDTAGTDSKEHKMQSSIQTLEILVVRLICRADLVQLNYTLLPLYCPLRSSATVEHSKRSRSLRLSQAPFFFMILSALGFWSWLGMTPKQAVFFLVFPQYLFKFLPENALQNILNSGLQLKHRAHKLKSWKEMGWKGSFDMTYFSSPWPEQSGQLIGSQWDIAMNCISSQLFSVCYSATHFIWWQYQF